MSEGLLCRDAPEGAVKSCWGPQGDSEKGSSVWELPGTSPAQHLHQIISQVSPVNWPFLYTLAVFLLGLETLQEIIKDVIFPWQTYFPFLPKKPHAIVNKWILYLPEKPAPLNTPIGRSLPLEDMVMV